MDILLNPESGAVIIEVEKCFVTFTTHNRALIAGPIELMLPTLDSAEELVRELQSFLDVARKVETPRIIDHAA